MGRPGLYLEDLFVHPEFRELGIGKALLQRVAAIAVVAPPSAAIEPKTAIVLRVGR